MTRHAEIDLTRIPCHVAIVMDGNGRWAEQRHQPRLFGHRAGVESVQDVVAAASELGVQVLTLYAFSSENWKRPVAEVGGLMSLLKTFLVKELDKMLNNNVRLTCMGDLPRLPSEVRSTLEQSMAATAGNSGLTLNLALSYGGRAEIIQGVQRIARQCLAGQLSPEAIDEEVIDAHLYSAGLPDPDLLIRTGGEARLSNFLLWQASYAEILFSPIMWPDFRRRAFVDAIVDFQGRERRFGKTGAQLRAG
ncbi:MAG: isoprenyl transferase [Desulfobulbaceae bacterium]|uniref:Isoprenyl transferase n=1 Tax=Candidatus Desulfatifera sulfidica TaxID=2841691 RepID=A0A8J6N8C9_9BACT|nr:isoprenyl transferase [Candidatus Desulfatifera sulfidica]